PDPQTDAGNMDGEEESSSAHLIALKAGTVINGRYRIERMLGRGGMGTVYLVRHTNTEEKLALKLLHPALAENEAAVQRFRTEARAPVRIESEHVVRVVDADVCEKLGQVPFMVMERLKGHDLRSELKRRGALPAGEVVLYLSQVARALDKAHQKGIIHRDLKPANMYVVRREDGSPLVKVLDFGIAKLTDDAAKELTVAGQVFGTPWYMAPEQARGELGAVGPATDLWALGLIAYQLLTGMNYWTADGMAALVGQICYEPMPPPTQRAPHLGPLFDMWFNRACNRDPSRRFPTARELVAELAQALGVNHSAAHVTASGEQRNFDSSLQMQAGGHLGQSGSNPGMAVAITGHPASGTPVPGTALLQGQGLAAEMDPSNPLFYTTQQTFGRKQSSTTAVLLGVVIALAVGVTGLGVWLLMPPSTAQTVPPAGDAAAAGERGGPADAAGTTAGDGAEEETPSEVASSEPTDETPDDAEDPGNDDEPDEPAKTAQKDEPPKPKTTAKPPSGGPPTKWTPPPKPSPQPPAPSVGEVTF
ncbi:MAG: serine/threonine-protein kinase, partial [Polyangiaceae bacterium]